MIISSGFAQAFFLPNYCALRERAIRILRHDAISSVAFLQMCVLGDLLLLHANDERRDVANVAVMLLSVATQGHHSKTKLPTGMRRNN